MNPEVDRIARAYCEAFLQETGVNGYVGGSEVYLQRLAVAGSVRSQGDLVALFREAMKDYRSKGYAVTPKAMCAAVVNVLASRTAPPPRDDLPAASFDVGERQKYLAEIAVETEGSGVAEREMAKIRAMFPKRIEPEPEEPDDEC